MAESNNEVFIFTWRIENFSMCPQQNEEWLESPTFRVSFLENTEWNLYLYPRNGDNISCYIERKSNDDCKVKVRIRFNFVVISEFTDKNVSKEVVVVGLNKGDTAGYRTLVCRDDIFKSKNGLLINDTFTIRCYIWRNVSGSFDGDTESIETLFLGGINATCESLKDSSKISTYSVRTRIKVRSAFFLWTIRRFSELKQGKKLMKTVRCSADEIPLLTMTFYLEEESEDDLVVRIEIRRKVIALTKGLFVRAKIKTLGSPKISQCLQEAEYYFRNRDVIAGGEEDDIWYLPTFLKKKVLKDRKYLQHTGDALNLSCEFAYSVPYEQLVFEYPTSNSSICYSENDSTCNYSCADTYRRLYRVGMFSDVSLRAGNAEFKVHKSILGISSDVFNTMFESEMREKASGIVDITDIDPDILDAMLYFIYTNKIEKVLKPEDAAKLYSAADKYNVASLKHRCCCVLISSLSVSNVCEILVFADIHQDEDLMEAVYSFIHTNKNEIFLSLDWQDFTTHHPRVAANIMLEILRSVL